MYQPHASNVLSVVTIVLFWSGGCTRTTSSGSRQGGGPIVDGGSSGQQPDTGGADVDGLDPVDPDVGDLSAGGEGEMGGLFEIASVDLPETVVAGAPRESLIVTWSGDPVFPVRIIYRAVEGGCPAGMCATPTREFAERTNPLEFSEAVWCSGLGDEVFVFEFEVLLIDATGAESVPVPAPVTCLPST